MISEGRGWIPYFWNKTCSKIRSRSWDAVDRRLQDSISAASLALTEEDDFLCCLRAVVVGDWLVADESILWIEKVAWVTVGDGEMVG